VPGSSTFGRPLQLSYAVNGVVGGPAGASLVHISNGNGTSAVMLLWEHYRAPGCATNGSHPPGIGSGLPWPVDDADVAQHYPERRHGGVFNVGFCDGHAEAMRRVGLSNRQFYIQ